MADIIDITERKLGQFSITSSMSTTARLTLLLWGQAGCGKTTIAATAKGRKLFIMFDADGADSIAGIENCDVVDMSNAAASITEQFKSEQNPLGLKQFLDDYDTFIFDSLTAIEERTLTHGIAQTKGATIERPSPGAYGIRATLIFKLVQNILKVTREARKDVIFIAHEGAPDKDDTGITRSIGPALGGQLAAKLPSHFSEVWNVYQPDGKVTRRIAVRPTRKRTPCKTRMFNTNKEAEFDWAFDAEDWDCEKNQKMRLDTWMENRNKAGKKIPLPS